MSGISNLASVITDPPWYLVFLLVFLSGGFLLSRFRGKHYLKGGILALYVSGVVFPLLPLEGFVRERPDAERFWAEVLVFLALWAVVSFFLTRRYLASDKDGVWWELLLLSVILAIFLIAAIFGVLDAKLVEANFLNLPENILGFFTEPAIARWLLITPILGVILL